MASVSRRKRGRPKGHPTVRINLLVKPETRQKIDNLVDKGDKRMASRGKVVDEKFSDNGEKSS